MRTLEELKEKLFNTLEKYPLLKEFFEEQLQERVKKDNWLDSPPVQLIFKDKEEYFEAIKELLSTAKNDANIWKTFRKKLSGADKEYDLKVKDVLAELNAYHYLLKEGFTDIRLIQESQSKAPDFEAKRGVDSVISEVKNIQHSTDLWDYTFVKFNSFALIDPELYEKKEYMFSFPNEEFDEVFGDADKLAGFELLYKLNISLRLENLDMPIVHNWTKEINKRSVNKKITCKVKKAEELNIMGQHERAFLIGNEFRKNLLFPFGKKLFRKIEEALAQLIEYDPDDLKKKMILINWQKPSDVIFFTEDEPLKIFESLNQIVKQVSRNIELIQI
jgi:hypothetical protein